MLSLFSTIACLFQLQCSSVFSLQLPCSSVFCIQLPSCFLAAPFSNFLLLGSFIKAHVVGASRQEHADADMRQLLSGATRLFRSCQHFRLSDEPPTFVFDNLAYVKLTFKLIDVLYDDYTVHMTVARFAIPMFRHRRTARWRSSCVMQG